MATSDTEGRDPLGGSRPAQPGGRATRGPDPDPGGEEEPGRLVPPYDGRSKSRGESELSEELAESTREQLADAKPGRHGATASAAEESPVRPEEVTDREPESAKGVGTSGNRRGEDVAKQESEPGREHTGAKGPSERPTGTSGKRASTGVDPQDSGAGGPSMPSGDQGG